MTQIKNQATIKRRYGFGSAHSGIYAFSLSAEPSTCLEKCEEAWGEELLVDRLRNGERVWILDLHFIAPIPYDDSEEVPK
ncbi:MAG: hypothetical protein ACREOP_09020 [Thermodesulfobacteriota bacterium]